MNNIFQDLLADRIMIVYLDNILIFTQTLETHQKAMCKVLKVLAKHKLFLYPKKCEFNKRQIKYLELVISENQVAMNPVNLSIDYTWQLILYIYLICFPMLQNFAVCTLLLLLV